MKKFRTLAGMAVFALGVLATSSCSKDEFFGLEESEVIDASTKTEIAMSQEYVDFVLACSEFAEYMSQPMDTTNAEVKEGPDGKRILYSEGPQLSAMALFEALKEKYPELKEADQMDFEEIMKIALSKNKALKNVAATKSDNAYPQSYSWANSVGIPYSCGSGSSYLQCYPSDAPAVQNVLFWASEYDDLYLGGIIFGDYSTATLISDPCYWPDIINQGYPVAEADFVISYSSGSLSSDPFDLAYELGPAYYEGNKTHYVYVYEGFDSYGRLNPSNYYCYSFTNCSE